MNRRWHHEALKIEERLHLLEVLGRQLSRIHALFPRPRNLLAYKADNSIVVYVGLQEKDAFTEDGPEEADPPFWGWGWRLPGARSGAFCNELHHQDLPPDASVPAPPAVAPLLDARGEGADGSCRKFRFQMFLDMPRVFVVAVRLSESNLCTFAV